MYVEKMNDISFQSPDTGSNINVIYGDTGSGKTWFLGRIIEDYPTAIKLGVSGDMRNFADFEPTPEKIATLNRILPTHYTRDPESLAFMMGGSIQHLLDLPLSVRRIIECFSQVMLTQGVYDTSGQTNIILLDDIDLHMGIQWQCEIIQILREEFPDVQFFITTQSVHILNRCHANEVLYSECGGDPARKPQSPYGLSPNQVLHNLLGFKQLRAAPFMDQLEEMAKLSREGDVDASRKFTRMLALGEDAL